MNNDKVVIQLVKFVKEQKTINKNLKKILKEHVNLFKEHEKWMRTHEVRLSFHYDLIREMRDKLK